MIELLRQSSAAPASWGMGETANMTTSWWCGYLAARCRRERRNLWLTPAELFGWVVAGVVAGDQEDDVFAALAETLADGDHAATATTSANVATK